MPVYKVDAGRMLFSQRTRRGRRHILPQVSSIDTRSLTGLYHVIAAGSHLCPPGRKMSIASAAHDQHEPSTLSPSSPWPSRKTSVHSEKYSHHPEVVQYERHSAKRHASAEDLSARSKKMLADVPNPPVISKTIQRPRAISDGEQVVHVICLENNKNNTTLPGPPGYKTWKPREEERKEVRGGKGELLCLAGGWGLVIHSYPEQIQYSSDSNPLAYLLQSPVNKTECTVKKAFASTRCSADTSDTVPEDTEI